MTGHIGRRAFITLLGGTAASWPLAARAQQPRKLPTIGFIVPGSPSSHGQMAVAFAHRLRELGWIEGRTVAIAQRWTEGRSERTAELAAELIRLKADVIVTGGIANVMAVKQATSVIPIVFVLRVIRLPTGSLRVWRAPEATSPACQSSRPISLPSDSKSSANSSPALIG
jgi:hypothetical protein